ncbi:SMP-30/gluconolactonase/LRE family protein [Phaeobacter sp. QD34_3]|uniref:SMP-30/gluconolactonase/LRE family protein n=1 Tax=unclassified Phaeobacter TaxID=2621772 RepID=UPI00237FD4ED|nr:MULTISPECIES: SMP-30/gluconolactonase/LRE family protein [unclassified Phaeobacter]MDE4131822.1 SMP-30/gluconolactonase/LRE family protein [Phaeobacter sp. QD34_3]MDE4135460.1 SMP-30/gluconolactonase/LRE family protein [Phaeobacter sp. QD34_24]
MRIVLGVLALGLAYLLFWPVPVDPVAYHPPKGPGFTGEFEENNALQAAQKVVLPDGAIGPEDLAVMPDGTVYTTDLAGTLYRIDGEVPERVEALGGRPLGLKAGPDGALYIADSFRGILRWNGPGTLETLVSEIDGGPVIYANQLDVARDGTIYFSNSSDRFDPETMGGTKPTSVLTIWEQSDTGYVARRTPDGKVEKIATGFVYTNGVALSQDEDFLLINETGRARVHRLWLKGPEAGKQELFLGNLPGYPDNLEAQGDGTFWLAFASPRVPSEVLMPYPFLRKVLWRLGPKVRPAPIHRGMVMQFDQDGNILRTLQDPAGGLGITTGARLVGDQLYVMTLDSDGFARLPRAYMPPIRR